MTETIRTTDDVLAMLDALLRDQGAWWDRFYADRSRPIPFFVDAPDESLVAHFESGRMTAGRALELGCGPGRNAVYLAEQGCAVEAVDVSSVSICWARERAAQHGVKVNFICGSIFDLPVEPDGYDIVYDTGCLHHVPPHRRPQYVRLVEAALRTGGLFGLLCFRDGCPDGGVDISGWDVYRGWSMQGGMAYSRERLESLFGPSFELVEHRIVPKIEQPAPVFGESFLSATLFRRK